MLDSPLSVNSSNLSEFPSHKGTKLWTGFDIDRVETDARNSWSDRNGHFWRGKKTMGRFDFTFLPKKWLTVNALQSTNI